METYIVPVEYTFSGHYVVKAESPEEAALIVERDGGCNFGSISNINNQVDDWSFDMKPDLKIKQITLEMGFKRNLKVNIERRSR